MSLKQKILKLRMDALVAARHASFWQKCITEHGEEKATAFYTHLGLNHLETKSFEWEGLTLSREPKEHEKIAVKGIHNAQESAKEAIGKTLLAMRAELITAGLLAIKRSKPGKFHELILNVSRETSDDLSEELVAVHQQGRALVALELQSKKACKHEGSLTRPVTCYKCLTVPEMKADESDFDELEDLVDLTTSRVTNDVQSRLIDTAARHALLGQTGDGLINAVTSEINAGTVTYIDRAARGLANKVINIGRSDEAEARSDEWDKIVYSALLDLNTCPACVSADGEESEDGSGLEPVPNPSCDGGDYCRCFWVYVFERITN